MIFTTKALRTQRVLLLSCILCSVFGMLSFADVTVIDVDNNTYPGETIEFTANEAVISSTDNAPASISFSNIAGIVFSSEEKKPIRQDKKNYSKFTFTNNDILYGTISDTSKEGFLFHNSLIGDRIINFERLSFIQKAVQPPGVETIPQAEREDVIVLISGDTDNGVTMELTPASINLRSTLYDKDMIYRLSDIKSISFFSLTAAKRRKEHSKDLKAVVYLKDNSMLTGVLSSSEKGSYTLVSDNVNYRIPVKSISYIYFKNNRCTYLSDMEPVAVKEYITGESNDSQASPSKQPDGRQTGFSPFLWHFQQDRRVITGNGIVLRGKRYFKGLAMHSHCELTYKLDGTYQKFFAILGLEDTVSRSLPGGQTGLSGRQTGASDAFEGTVRFSVYKDNKKIYSSGIIKKDTPLEKIFLDVKGAKELRLVVDDAGDGYIMDRAIWASARLIK